MIQDYAAKSQSRILSRARLLNWLGATSDAITEYLNAIKIFDALVAESGADEVKSQLALAHNDVDSSILHVAILMRPAFISTQPSKPRTA